MAKTDVRVEWNGKRVVAQAERGMVRRVKLAGQVTRDLTVKNLSKPVTKIRGPGGTRVDPKSRSKSGEFPRADTTRLMKSIFWKLQPPVRGSIAAIVATSLFYGAFHEVKTGRSFLRRTIKENKRKITKILTNPNPPIL